MTFWDIRKRLIQVNRWLQSVFSDWSEDPKVKYT